MNLYEVVIHDGKDILLDKKLFAESQEKAEMKALSLLDIVSEDLEVLSRPFCCVG